MDFTQLLIALSSVAAILILGAMAVIPTVLEIRAGEAGPRPPTPATP